MSSLVLSFAVGCRGASQEETAPIVDGETGTNVDSVANDSNSSVETGGETGSPDSDPVLDRTCPAPTLELVQAWDQKQLLGPGVESSQLPNEQGPGVALGDIDGDGWLDAVMVIGAYNSVAFRNDGKGNLVKDDTITANGARLPPANSVAMADMDSDGDQDIVLARALGFDDVILYNNGGSGEFSSYALAESTGEALTPSIADFDVDGDLDLFVPGFTHRLDIGKVQGGEQVGDGLKLYLQQGQDFVLENQRLPNSVMTSLTYHAAWLDIEQDGDLDLYLANDYGQYVVPNQALINDGFGFFMPDLDCFCSLEITAMGLAIADFNGDHYPDMYVTNWGTNVYLLNQGDGSFFNGGEAYGGQPQHEDSVVAWGAVPVDLNRDTWPDLPVVYGPVYPNYNETGEETHSPLEQPDALLMNDGTGAFYDYSEEIGFTDTQIGRGLAVGDLDNDGLPDLVAAGRVGLKHWRGGGGCESSIKLKLEAGGGDPGIGARVDVDVAERSYTQWMLPSTAFGSSAAELFLGLYNEPKADRVTITWLDGSQSVIEDAPANTPLVVRRDSGGGAY